MSACREPGRVKGFGSHMDMQTVGAVVALLAGLAAGVGTVITSLRKVEEGNYATLRNRVATVEKNQRQQNIIIAHLTEWQLIARQWMRQSQIQAATNGLNPTEEMGRLQERLDRELNIEDLLANEVDYPEGDGPNGHWWTPGGRHSR